MTGSAEVGLRRALAVADLLIDADDERALLPALLPMLLDVLPGDSLVWSVRPYDGGGPMTVPGGLLTREALAAFARDKDADPLVAHTTTGPGTPVLRSDLQSRAEFHALAAYADVYRPLGAEHQLAMAFPAGWAGDEPRSVCLAVNRRRGDFGDADRAAAELLRPRLARAMRRLAPPARDRVTRREAAVLDLLARGLTDRQIARRLAISPRTVEKHLEHAYPKLGVHGRVDAAVTWLSAGDGRRGPSGSAGGP
ncbi:helix-turn-helix transcriptional regulator [Actinomadura verrucosospora]|uniref:LuxR family transcriptional regulator n=1 Tax=Actinomadura verrucosospora TaxID=46165 RepID=A0A7D3ZP46_ACTVE|nr:helix-turn-helix transcriptional regulator [Actinomadura verrucosospora]QKG23823.1 LuxR family transcriptional regulator [Actinomadura verrucosospora]